MCSQSQRCYVEIGAQAQFCLFPELTLPNHHPKLTAGLLRVPRKLELIQIPALNSLLDVAVFFVCSLPQRVPQIWPYILRLLLCHLQSLTKTPNIIPSVVFWTLLEMKFYYHWVSQWRTFFVPLIIWNCFGPPVTDKIVCL